MEAPRLGVESELQLPAYTTATAAQDPSCVCDLHHGSQQRQIINPLSKARDRTRNLMVPSRIHFHCTMAGTPNCTLIKKKEEESDCSGSGCCGDAGSIPSPVQWVKGSGVATAVV